MSFLLAGHACENRHIETPAFAGATYILNYFAINTGWKACGEP